MKKTIIFILAYICFAYSIYSQTYSKVTIGYSLKKRPIDVYKFGEGKQLLFILAGIHGNEENTMKTAYFIIEKLKENKIDIGENKSVWIIPETNPDGLARGRRLNDNNVDLNRNFDTSNWKPHYTFFNNLLSCGKFPFSEVESKVLRDLFIEIKDHYTIVVLTLHSSGNAIIPGNESYFNERILNYVSDNSTYFFNSVGYDANGDLTCWLSEKLKIASLTIEFKTKRKTEVSEIANIISGLQNVDFDKDIYNKSFDLNFIFKNNNKIDTLLQDLPNDIVKRIKSTNENQKIFIDYFNKLSKDDDLLILVNKQNFLSEDYIPEDLVTINNEFPTNKKSIQLRKIIINDLKNMYKQSENDNIKLVIVSAYRSYFTQKEVYKGWVYKLGEKEAKRVSAIPGASQHQLGTVIDFNSLNENFSQTKEGKWLFLNAYKFGFILSYPEGMENITGYKYEPWHYRYVGKEASFIIYNYFNNSLELFLNWYWDKKINK
ncbi:MAG: hypothetical protein A2Y34_08315 [Spirochaetes bacterium GWC1_27_15]|nr:MAG: hypothetical protein A2Y34_08315 [Spirochaetes bacterium GWC1_27_15]